MGKMKTDQFAEFLAAIVRSAPRDLDTDVVQGWITNQDALARVLMEALAPPAVTKSLGDIYRVTVDYTRSLAEMIAAGKYDWTNPDINEKNFPIVRPEQAVDGVIEVILVHLNKVVSTADFLRYCEENSLRPGTLPELLALAVAHPELQRQFPIVALGSVWASRDGGRYSPDLYDWDGRRELNLDERGAVWREGCRFLAVGK
jgi:hypothetical protein